jgi:hypothetical protein
VQHKQPEMPPKRQTQTASIREARLEKALRNLVHEVTHLSPAEDDGSHWCRITAEALHNAREALCDVKVT